MGTCVGVVFSPGGKVQRYAAGELTLRWNDHVVCQTPKGEELGRVVLAPHDWAPEGGTPPARCCARPPRRTSAPGTSTTLPQPSC